MKKGISIIVPVFNEEAIIEKSLSDCLFFLKSKGIITYEILVVCNGCTDTSVGIVAELAQKERKIRLIELQEKGLGLALKSGILESKHDWICFLPADNPFNFIELEIFMQERSDFHTLFTSKNHPRAVYKNRPLRKIASRVYSSLVKILFDISLSDTQGTFLGKSKKLKALMPFCTSKTAFFQTQLALYSHAHGHRIKEIPVRYTPPKSHRSKFFLPRDGLHLFIELLKERLVVKPKVSI